MKIFRFLFIALLAGACPVLAADAPKKAPAKPAAPAATASAPAPKPGEKPKPKLDPAVISVRSEVNRASITIGDPVEYSVLIKHAPDVQILSSIPAPEQEVLKIKKVEDIKSKEGKMLITGRKYTLTTFRLGDFILDPVTIEYRKGGGDVQTIETDKIYIHVKSVDEGKPKTDIRGIKFVLTLPKQVVFLLFILLAVLLAAAGYLIYLKFFKKPEGEEAPAGPHLTPAEEALFNLNQLFDSDLLRRGKIKDYYLRLSEILRIYFEKHFGILAVEYTTDEILKALRQKEIPMALREKIQEVLEAADLAKFAKWSPEPAEIIRINQKSKEIVEQTKPEEKAPEAARGI